MARYLFQLSTVTPAGSYVRLDSASGSASPTAVSPADSAYVVPGAVLRSDATTGELPRVAAGVATLYQKTLNASGAVTATATLTGALVDGPGPGALEPQTFPIPVNTDPAGLSGSATSLASNAAFTGTYAVVKQLAAASGGDDASALNAALSSGAKVVRGLPGASYVVSTLTVPAGVRLDMTGCTITQAASTSGNLCNLTGAGASVVGGTWDGNAINQSASNNRGIAIQSVDDCLVRDATVQNTKFTGVYAVGTNRARIERCRTSATGYIGIFVEVLSTGATVTGNAVVGCTVDRSTISAASISEGGLKVHGNSSSKRCDATLVDGNTVIMPTSPTDPAAVSIEVTYSYRSVVKGNNTSGGAMGISLAASDNSVVSGNSVYNAGGYGIENAGSRYATISGNVIDGNSLTTLGIMLDQGGGNSADYTAVTGNTVVRTASGCFQSQQAIRLAISANTFSLNSANYCANIQSTSGTTIAGNTFEGNSVATKAIMLDSCSQVSVTGNAIRNFTQNGVLLYTQSAYTITEVMVTGNVFSNAGTSVQTQVSNGGSVSAFCKVWGNTGATDQYDLVNGVAVYTNTGNPIGVQGANKGSVYIQRNGGVGSVFWVNEGGTNTSWYAHVGCVTNGTATLVGGTVTVSNASVTANSIVRLSYKTTGGTPGAVYVSARSAGSSFTITSTSASDTSVIYYEVMQW